MSHHHETLSGARLGWTIALNLVITAAELLGGIVAGSLALITDALHNLSDAIALVVSYAAIRAARRPKSLDFTFGWKRAQVLAAVLNSSVLVAVAVFMIAQAVERFAHPAPTAGGVMILVAGLGLVANVIGTLLLRTGARDSINIRSSYLHLLSDAVSSAGVIVGGAAILLFGGTWVDPLITILISVYILRESVQIIWEAANILMLRSPSKVDVEALETSLTSFPGVRDLHHVHMWQVDEHDRHFEAHVVLDDMPLARATELLAQLESVLQKGYGFHHSILQLEVERGHEKSLVGG